MALAPRGVARARQSRTGGTSASLAVRAGAGIALACRVGEMPMSNACRLLIVTYHFGNDGPPGGLRWFGITKYLVRLGWNVVVVTGTEPSGGESATGVRVEYCPRLWTLWDGVQLVRRRALGRPRRPSPSTRLNSSHVSSSYAVF